MSFYKKIGFTTYVWNLEKMVKMILFAKQKWRHRCRKQVYRYHGGKGGNGMKGEIAINMYRVTGSVDMNLSKPWETVKDREARHAAVHAVART